MKTSTLIWATKLNYVEGYNGSDGAEGGTDLDLLMTFGNIGQADFITKGARP
jgi:hypothetical protein